MEKQDLFKLSEQDKLLKGVIVFLHPLVLWAIALCMGGSHQGGLGRL